MTEDQLYRGLAMGAAVPVYAYLIALLKGYLSRSRAKSGRTAPERIGYWLGSRWPRGNRARQ